MEVIEAHAWSCVCARAECEQKYYFFQCTSMISIEWCQGAVHMRVQVCVHVHTHCTCTCMATTALGNVYVHVAVHAVWLNAAKYGNAAKY